MDGKTDRWIDGWMESRIYGWIDGNTDRWTDGWMDGWKDG
jgi:hypothetical protein